MNEVSRIIEIKKLVRCGSPSAHYHFPNTVHQSCIVPDSETSGPRVFFHFIALDDEGPSAGL